MATASGLLEQPGAILTFLVTLSFLLTLPGVWKLVDGVPVTEFFIFRIWYCSALPGTTSI